MIIKSLIHCLLGLFILSTVVFQNYYLAKNNLNYNSLNYFSYFTIWSNLIVSFIFLVSSFKLFNTKLLEFLRGGATLYILLTGIIFITLLKGQNDLFLPWVNVVLHYIVPLIMLVYLIVYPLNTVSFKQSLIWLLLIVFYLIYSLIRGNVSGWYPYDFVNLTTQGIEGVVINSVVITLFVLVIDWIMLLFKK